MLDWLTCSDKTSSLFKTADRLFKTTARLFKTTDSLIKTADGLFKTADPGQAQHSAPGHATDTHLN